VDATFTPVEALVNDSQLDAMAVGRSSGPVVRLSREDVANQIELMSKGLLGRGGWVACVCVVIVAVGTATSVYWCKLMYGRMWHL
jgi:hypothetical protein